MIFCEILLMESDFISEILLFCSISNFLNIESVNNGQVYFSFVLKFEDIVAST